LGDRVDGEHKVDVGWLREALVDASQKGYVRSRLRCKSKRGELDRRKRWWNNFQTASRRSLGGSRSINGPLPSTRSNTWNSDD